MFFNPNCFHRMVSILLSFSLCWTSKTANSKIAKNLSQSQKDQRFIWSQFLLASKIPLTMSVQMAFQTLHVHIWQKAPLFSKYPLSTGIASSTHYESLAGVLGIVMHVECFIFFYCHSLQDIWLSLTSYRPFSAGHRFRPNILTYGLFRANAYS